MNQSEAGDDEIERQRKEWAKRQRAEHLEFAKRFRFHTSATFMDYLHGDVVEDEAETACLYEYTRELPAIWKAAKRRDKLKVKGLDGFSDQERIAWKKLSPAERNEQAALRAFEYTGLQERQSLPFHAMNFLVCESFPQKDWQELTPAERKSVMRFERKRIPPLAMTDVWTLKGFGVFDQFNAIAEQAKPIVEDHDPQQGKFARPYKPVPPLAQKWESVFYAMFDVDYSKSEAQLVNEFKEWLRLPENQMRLAEYQKPKTGATGKSLDRLKDLSAWRLYRECEKDWNKANDFARRNRKRFAPKEIRERFKTKAQRKKYQAGDPKPFRDAKPQGGIPPNQAELFGEEADGREAQRSAWKYLVEIMPKEFAPPGPHMLATFVELEKLASKA